MTRHAFDPVSFVAGLVFTAIAALYLIAEFGDLTVDGRWVLPLALIGLGLAGIAGAVTSARRPEPASPTPAGGAEPAQRSE